MTTLAQTETQLVDAQVEEGKTYYYVLTALDALQRRLLRAGRQLFGPGSEELRVT